MKSVQIIRPRLVKKLIKLLLILFLVKIFFIAIFYMDKNNLKFVNYKFEIENEWKETHNLMSKSSSKLQWYKDQDIILVTVVCGKKFEESLVMIKSSLLFNKLPIKVIVFVEINAKRSFQKTIEEWNFINKNIFDIRLIKFPRELEELKNTTTYCGELKLFFPVLYN